MRKKKKRTLSPEHIAKMQEGRKKATIRKARVEAAEGLGKKVHTFESKTDKILNGVRRK